MGRPEITGECPGACNSRYRRAWTEHEDTHAAWRRQCAKASEDAAAILATVPEGEDPGPDVYDALFAITLPADPDDPGAPTRLPDPPEEPTVACTLGEPVWCASCVRRIRAALVDIGDLAARLEAWADGHRGAGSGEHTSTRRASAPSPSPVTDELDKLYGLLADVERLWREHAGHPQRPNRSRGGDARQRTLEYLLEQSDHILANPGSTRFGQGVIAWQVKLQRMSKTDPVVRSRPGRCPRCGWVNVLYLEDGITKCRNGKCGRYLSEEEYLEQVLGAADTSVVSESRAARTS
ncbi:hypothetical protein [Actinomadura opuntiae]|uniref:hypothetical protein n=1 Tax=Actinomadura sp. OS1-43 TaxID=604315 RepID=UPI00255AF836|nr:hypothetical protein [Actinomadura sp. OS1-43]MDL4812802.1 hypothetical protein [Actinomadura sp. OS1-43]